MNEIENWVDEVHQGASREVLDGMPDKSVDCVVTSPPYYALRDYGEDVESIWGGEDSCEHEWDTVTKESQGGHNTEDNPPDVRANEDTQNTRLRGSGGIESNYCNKCGAWKGQLGLEPNPQQFVDNITEISSYIYDILKDTGSFYLNLGDTFAGSGSGQKSHKESTNSPIDTSGIDIEQKCKMLIPHRVAISLIEDGWICRNDIVWKKTNPMPESVLDRRSTTFEYIFHFVKEKEYYYDLDSIRKPHKEISKKRSKRGPTNINPERDGQHNLNVENIVHENGKNPGDLIETTTASYSNAHFATYPVDLIEPLIKSSCPEEGVVLDPFIGSGTTAIAAEKHNRDWIGIDLNKDYVDMSYDRIDEETTKIFDDGSVFDY
jgi:site-specific DNA-methyltransferase (cytosine-N4-specific)